MNSIVTETIIIETQALVSNAMQALDDNKRLFAQTCLERAYNNLQNLLTEKR